MKGYKGVGPAKRPMLKKIDNSRYYSWCSMKKRENVKKEQNTRLYQITGISGDILQRT